MGQQTSHQIPVVVQGVRACAKDLMTALQVAQIGSAVVRPAKQTL